MGIYKKLKYTLELQDRGTRTNMQLINICCWFRKLFILVDALDKSIDCTVDAQQQQIAHNKRGQAHKGGQRLVDEARRKYFPDHQMSAVYGAGEHGAKDLQLHEVIKHRNEKIRFATLSTYLEALQHKELCGQLETDAQKNILILIQRQLAACHIKAHRIGGDIGQCRSSCIRFAATVAAGTAAALDEIRKQGEQRKGLRAEQRIHAVEKDGPTKGIQNDKRPRNEMRLSQSAGAAHKGGAPVDLR